MNWKQLNQAYPLATIEYLRSEDIITNDSKTMVCTLVDVDDSTYFFKTDNEESFCIGSEEVLKMPEYFDALGIHVDACYNKESEADNKYFCALQVQEFEYEVIIESGRNESMNLSDMERFDKQVKHFPTRRKALEAGVIKAFEIRDEQLKQKEQP